MTGEPFVLDRTENPHPRMLREAVAARQAWWDATAREFFGGPPATPERNYWRGFLAAMAAATGSSAADIVRWMDRARR